LLPLNSAWFSTSRVEPCRWCLSGSLSQVDELPRLIQRAEVEFPREVMGRREISAVALRLIVAPNGTVQEPEVLHETGARFAAEALAAVGQWVFEPARRNGEATPVMLEFPIVWRP
jgi:protein TonB